MPSKSKAQQRLMGQAYALKKGDIKLDDIDKEWRDQIKDLADSMSLEDLKDYAETKTEDLPDKVKETLKPGSVPGMGPVTLPGNPTSLNDFPTQKTGSGDLAHPIHAEDEDEEDKKNKKAWLLTFEQFSNESIIEKSSSELAPHKIDWTPLENKIGKILGIKKFKFDDITWNEYSYGYNLISNMNLKSKVRGVLSNVFKDIRVSSTDVYDRKRKHEVISGSIVLRFETNTDSGYKDYIILFRFIYDIPSDEWTWRDDAGLMDRLRNR